MKEEGSSPKMSCRRWPRDSLFSTVRSVKREGSMPDGSEDFETLVLVLDGPAVKAEDD